MKTILLVDIKKILIESELLQLQTRFEGIFSFEHVVHKDLLSYPKYSNIHLALIGIENQTQIKDILFYTSRNISSIALFKEKNKELWVKAMEMGVDAILDEDISADRIQVLIQRTVQRLEFHNHMKHEKDQLLSQHAELSRDFRLSSELNLQISEFVELPLALVDRETILFSNYSFNQFFGSHTIKGEKVQEILAIWPEMLQLFEAEDRKKIAQETQILSCQKIKQVKVKVIRIPFDRFLIQIIETIRTEHENKFHEAILSLHEFSNKSESFQDISLKISEILSEAMDIHSLMIGFYEPIENYIDVVFRSGMKLPNHLDANRFPFSDLIRTRNEVCLEPKELKEVIRKENLSYCSQDCHWLGIPLINNNQLIGVLSVSKAIQSGKFSEQERQDIRLLSTTLSSIFDMKLTKKDLRKALERAQHSDKLKENFLSNISHEIRTPLNSIIGFSSMLYDNISEEERNEYVNLIMDGGQNLMRIIDNIVDIAKIQTGDLKINRIEVDILGLFENLNERFSYSPEVSSGEINFQVETPTDMEGISLHTDPFRLNQILENLVLNALKFTEKGSVKVGLSQIKSESVELFVSDTGIGIPEDKISTIFERFVQLETGHIREYGGNGLGLSITQKLVELLNGKIHVKSKVGAGTTFIVELPIEQAKFVKPRKSKSKFNWQGKHILLVDDISANLEYLDILLHRTKVETHLAVNGLKAVEAMDHNPRMDLVLMDVKMPIMDGYQATRIIKQKYPNTKVIIQTAFTEGVDKDMAFETGCDGFIQKPIKAAELLHLIEKTLQS
jgi:signal transduction histidine kinase/AmiR/NasT family two-component response regulator